METHILKLTTPTILLILQFTLFIFNSMSPLQVCILDMNKTLGEAAQSDLSEKFGDKNVYFFVCDVTKTSDIEGMQNIREMSMYVQLPWPFSL